MFLTASVNSLVNDWPSDSSNEATTSPIIRRNARLRLLVPRRDPSCIFMPSARHGIGIDFSAATACVCYVDSLAGTESAAMANLELSAHGDCAAVDGRYPGGKPNIQMTSI